MAAGSPPRSSSPPLLPDVYKRSELRPFPAAAVFAAGFVPRVAFLRLSPRSSPPAPADIFPSATFHPPWFPHRPLPFGPTPEPCRFETHRCRCDCFRPPVLPPDLALTAPDAADSSGLLTCRRCAIVIPTKAVFLSPAAFAAVTVTRGRCSLFLPIFFGPPRPGGRWR